MVVAFLIGFIVGGLVGISPEKRTTNTPPPIPPTPPKFKRGRKWKEINV